MGSFIRCAPLKTKQWSKLNGTVALSVDEEVCVCLCVCVCVCVYPYGSTPEEKQIVRTQKYI